MTSLRGPKVSGPMAPELPIRYAEGTARHRPAVASVPVSEIKHLTRGPATPRESRRRAERTPQSREIAVERTQPIAARRPDSPPMSLRSAARGLAAAHGDGARPAAARRDRDAARACTRRCATACSAAANASGRHSLSRPRAALGLSEDQVEAAACAIELIHVYSLVHDDLPAMDDDDLRRGRPTCHKAFDEATAILVGDALQPLAFQLLARDPALPASPGGAPALDRLAQRSERHVRHGRRPGHRSRGAGQEARHRRKSRICMRARPERLSGRACSWRPHAPRILRRDRYADLDRFAAAIGLAFQIQDDLLDVLGDVSTLGKADRRRPGARETHAPDGHRHRGLPGARAPAASRGARVRWSRSASAPRRCARWRTGC